MRILSPKRLLVSEIEASPQRWSIRCAARSDGSSVLTKAIVHPFLLDIFPLFSIANGIEWGFCLTLDAGVNARTGLHSLSACFCLFLEEPKRSVSVCVIGDDDSMFLPSLLLARRDYLPWVSFCWPLRNEWQSVLISCGVPRPIHCWLLRVLRLVTCQLSVGRAGVTRLVWFLFHRPRFHFTAHIAISPSTYLFHLAKFLTKLFHRATLLSHPPCTYLTDIKKFHCYFTHQDYAVLVLYKYCTTLPGMIPRYVVPGTSTWYQVCTRYDTWY